MSGKPKPGVASGCGPASEGSPGGKVKRFQHQGQALLQDRPCVPCPQNPRTIGTGGLVWVPSSQFGGGLQPDSPPRPWPQPQAAAPPQEPHESGICPHVLWPHQIFELTFTSSRQARTVFE